MKKLITVLLTSLIVLSCNRQDQETPEPTDFGYLSMNISVSITEEAASSRVEAVPTDNWKVTIFKADGTPELVFDPYSLAPAEVQLPTGEYYVEAHSNNFAEAAFENPYYFGRSANFQIDKEELATIDINAELANSKVAINYSPNVTSTFNSYSGTVIVVSSGANLVYNETETREGYFVSEPLSVVVDLSYTKLDGTFITRQFTANIDAQPKTLYSVNVDATLEDGKITMSINVDETFAEEVIELGDLTQAPPPGCYFESYSIVSGQEIETYTFSIGTNGRPYLIEVTNNLDPSWIRTTELTYDSQDRMIRADHDNGERQWYEVFDYSDLTTLGKFRRFEFELVNGVPEQYQGATFDINSDGQLNRVTNFDVVNGQPGWNTHVDYFYTTLDDVFPYASKEYVTGQLVWDRVYQFDNQVNPFFQYDLYLCDDCVDLEFVDFSPHNLIYQETTTPTEVTSVIAQYIYDDLGNPVSVNYQYSTGERFQQSYAYECY
ncbi:MAG: DUF4493 domain-containing protein [Cyclobacteriaceae bacterium]